MDLPLNLPDIPRLYTGIAEWLSCMVILLICPRKLKLRTFVMVSVSALLIQCAFLVLTGDTDNLLWILCMAAAVLLMFFYIFLCAEMNLLGVLYCTSVAFLCAECTASLEWQFHTWISLYIIRKFQMDMGFILSAGVLITIYGLVFFCIYQFLSAQLTVEYLGRITRKECMTAFLTALITFIFSNLSFVFDKSPFSGQVMVDIFIIRTLVDIGGMAILGNFQSRILEYIAEEELSAVRHLLDSQYEQYRNFQESEEMLHIMQHDLKHQIDGLRGMSDEEKKDAWVDMMENELEKWWIPQRTGNAVFDTILAAKLRKARTLDIRLTCVADGSYLSMLHVSDICTIFGNALDNAMESVMQIADPEKRLIHISVSEQKNFLFISIANILGSPLRENAGTLLTTKDDSRTHGYGMKGIRHVVSKYDGNVSYHVENGWFELNILIPARL